MYIYKKCVKHEVVMLKNSDMYTMCKKEGEAKLKYSGVFF